MGGPGLDRSTLWVGDIEGETVEHDVAHGRVGVSGIGLELDHGVGARDGFEHQRDGLRDFIVGRTETGGNREAWTACDRHDCAGAAVGRLAICDVQENDEAMRPRREAGEPQFKGATGGVALNRDAIRNEARAVADGTLPPDGAQVLPGRTGGGERGGDFAEALGRESAAGHKPLLVTRRDRVGATGDAEIHFQRGGG